MRLKSTLAGLLALLAGFSRAGGGAVTKAQLLSMARENVDPKVIRAIVERDCIDFDVDAGNAAELSRSLPPDVLEAAIACRKTAAPPTTESGSREAGPVSKGVEENAGAGAGPNSNPMAAAGGGELRLRATFIGESGELSCSCLLDGRLVATLTKGAQGEFGQAVERSKTGRESGYFPVSAGNHRVVFNCDPGAQHVSVDLQVQNGERHTVEIAETMFRHWKLRSSKRDPSVAR